MIPPTPQGQRGPRRVVSYLPIDHCAEGYTFVEPGTDETFWGIEFSYYEDACQPFIEVRLGDHTGTLLRTVNASDVAEIKFA